MHVGAPIRSPKGSIFFGAIWISLAVVLVSALAPMGEAMIRNVGSAFDPSTTALALRGKSEQLQNAGEGAPERRRFPPAPAALITPPDLTSITATDLPHRVPAAPFGPDTSTAVLRSAGAPFASPRVRAPPAP